MKKTEEYLEQVSEATGIDVSDILSKSKKAEFVVVRKAIAYNLAPILTLRQIMPIINRSLHGVYKMVDSGHDMKMCNDLKFMRVLDLIKDIKY